MWAKASIPCPSKLLPEIASAPAATIRKTSLAPQGDAIAPSGMRRRAPVRRRFGNICIRLGTTVRGICNQDPYFAMVKWLMKIYENPELFCPF